MGIQPVLTPPHCYFPNIYGVVSWPHRGGYHSTFSPLHGASLVLFGDELSVFPSFWGWTLTGSRPPLSPRASGPLAKLSPAGPPREEETANPQKAERVGH